MALFFYGLIVGATIGFIIGIVVSSLTQRKKNHDNQENDNQKGQE